MFIIWRCLRCRNPPLTVLYIKVAKFLCFARYPVYFLLTKFHSLSASMKWLLLYLENLEKRLSFEEVSENLSKVKEAC